MHEIKSTFIWDLDSVNIACILLIGDEEGLVTGFIIKIRKNISLLWTPSSGLSFYKQTHLSVKIERTNSLYL